MIRALRAMSVAGFALATASAGSAEDAPAQQPQIVVDVLACRAITDDDARLACFDGATARFGTAIEAGDVVTADRAEVQRNNRSLFGLSLPRIRIFGGDQDQVEEIEGEVAAISFTADGKARVRLADGAIWVQTDDRPVIGVRPGLHVTIRRAALGTFFLAFDRHGSVRARRVN